MLKINLRLTLTLLCLSLLFSVITYANGVLDASFGVGGKAPLGFPACHSGQKVLIQPDNKILVFGHGSGTNVYVGRYNENGSFDNTFNSGSAKQIAADTANGIMLQPDNKILVSVGKFFGIFGGTPNYGSLVCRLNADGSSDTSFGDEFGGGCALVGAFRSPKQAFMSVLNDGKILVVHSNPDNMDVLRLKPDGKRDETFVFRRHEITGFAISLTPVADAKHLLATGSGIARIGADGTIDLSFGNNGFVALPDLRQIVIQPDGKILIAGQQTRRLTGDGQPDASFPPGRESYAIDVLPNGRIIFVGNDAADPNTRVLYLADERNRLIGREKTQYVTVKALSNGKFLAVGGTGLSSDSLDRYNSFTSLANGIGDMDNDEKSEISVFRPGANTFYFLKSTGFVDYYTAQKPIGNVFIENYNGDFQSELVWWTPGTPQSCYYGSHALSSSDGCFAWGLAADKAVKGDFDGDNKTDLAIFRDGLWHIRKSSNGESLYYNWGQSGDKPVPADYDGDGITDAAIYRPSTGVWWVLKSSDFSYTAVQFGIAEDKPVQADYDGDGRADFAVYRPSSGVWYLFKSTEGFAAAGFGLNADNPVPGDYDGDGLTDIAVFRPSDGNWYLLQSKNGFSVVHWGQNGDVPLSIAYAANN